MAELLGVRFDARIVLLTLVFAAVATTAFIAFAGLYRAMFSLLVGWIVVFVLVAKALLGEEDDGGEA
jgi:hypothetical protein